MLVIGHDVDHRTVEHGLIAQHRVLSLLLPQLVLRDIAGSTDNIHRRAILAATEDGEPDGKAVKLAMRTVLRSHVEGLSLRLLQRDIGQCLLDALVVLLHHRVEEEVGRQVVTVHHAVLVEGRDGLGGYMIEPYPHVARLQDERQSAVAATERLRHALLLATIDDEEEERQQDEQQQDTDDQPYPRRNARVLTLRIEPLVLDGLQPALCTEHGVHTVHLLKQARIV